MVGITSYGAYIPFWRLSRDALSKGLRGERSVANFDEDSITMAVAAVSDCLNGRDHQTVDGLFLASTTFPYKEKLCATTVASAIDLPQNIFAADFANSLRAGTTALRSAVDAVKAGSANQVVVAAADCRLGFPGSDLEQNSGDGAAALVIGDADVAVEVEACYSVSNEMFDVWRSDSDTFVRSFDARFIATEGYLKVVAEAASELMRRANLSPKDFAKVVFYSPDPRRHLELARGLGFDPKTQVQDLLADAMGNTGAAYPLMLLVAALEQANPGDRILLASYGNGSDAFVLRVTEQIEKIRSQRGIKGHLSSKKVLTDYKTYLRWRGLLSADMSRYPPFRDISASALWRERSQIYPLHGVKCKACGTIQFPQQRVCVNCHTKDQFEHVKLSDKRGQVFTYSFDYQFSPVDTPMVIAVVDFEVGGRMVTMMTDRDLDEITVGMPVEMSFRKLYSTDGIHNYFWKSIPLRF